MPRELYRHRILTLESFPVQTSAGTADYVRLRMSDWVNVVAITTDEQLVLVRQHRWGIDAPTLEIPGGAVEDGEDPAISAERELLEESGFSGGVCRPLGWVWANPAIQDNKTWMYLFEGVTRVAEPLRGPGEEDLEVVLVPAAEIRRLLEDEVVTHALAVVALQRLLLAR